MRRNPVLSIGDIVSSKTLPPPNRRWGIGKIMDFTDSFAVVKTSIGTFKVKKNNLKHYKEPEYEHLFTPLENPKKAKGIKARRKKK